MKKQKLLTFLVVVSISVQSLIVPTSADVLQNTETLPEISLEDSVQNVEEIEATNEYGLPYSSEALQAYESYVTELYEQNITCMCMDILNASTEARADVQIYPYIGATDQKWTLQRVS